MDFRSVSKHSSIEDVGRKVPEICGNQQCPNIAKNIHFTTKAIRKTVQNTDLTSLIYNDDNSHVTTFSDFYIPIYSSPEYNFVFIITIFELYTDNK